MADSALMNQAELAALFEVTPKTIQNWTAQGCPIERKGGRGKPSMYRAADVIRWREDRAKLAATGDLAQMDMDEARRRKLAAEAAMAELVLDQKRGDVVLVALVEKEVGDCFSTLRARLLALGSALAPRLELAPDTAAIREIVDDAVIEVLDDISGTALAFTGDAGVDDPEGFDPGEGDEA